MSCQDICVYMDTDDLSSEFSYNKTVRAAKPHRCEECGRAIAVGESHEYAAGKCEGDFWSARTCAECAEIRRAFCCSGWVLGMLWYEIREQLFPTWDAMKAIDCLAKLTTDTAITKMRTEYTKFCEDRDS